MFCCFCQMPFEIPQGTWREGPSRKGTGHLWTTRTVTPGTRKKVLPPLLASQGLTEIMINVASTVFFFTSLNAESESPGKARKNRHISEYTNWNWKQVIRTEGKKINTMLVSWQSCCVSATFVFLELDSSNSAVQSLHPHSYKYCSTSAQRTALGSTF